MTHVKLAGVLAQGGVVLFNKVPANLILGGGRRGIIGTLSGICRNSRCRSKLLLVVGVAVCCHIEFLLCFNRVWVLFRGRNDRGLRNVVYRRQRKESRGRRGNEYSRDRARQKLRPEHANFSFALALPKQGKVVGKGF